MSAIAIAAIALVVAFGSAIAAMFANRFLPEHHLNAASKDVIKLTIGLIATLSALVLGMLIGVASGTFQTQRNEIERMAADVLLLDRVLDQYGPAAGDARAGLRQSVGAAVERMWPSGGDNRADLDPGAMREQAEALWGRIARLQPATDEQRAMKGRAIEIATGLAQARFLLFAQRDSGVPGPFVAVLIGWLALIFAGFGFMAPRNPTVAVALFAGALCVAGAFFLLIEMTQPFDGLMKISSDPLRNALALLGR